MQDDRQGDADAREFFRIDDEAHLEYRVVEPAEYAAVVERGGPAAGEEACSLVAELHRLSSQAGLVMPRIRKTDPEVAQYLALLERKIDLVARMAEGGRHRDIRPNARVMLSANGLGFFAEEPIAAGAKLELRLLFFPSYLCIHAYGEVIHSTSTPRADAERPYRIGVEFTVLRDQEREALIKHTLERQSARLRRERGE